MSESIVAKKSYAFGVRIVNLFRTLRQRGVERELLSQLLRAGTSIAANLSESQYAQSPADFHAKLRISLKECSESHMWLRLLHDTDGLTDTEFDSIESDCIEIRRMLSASLRTIQDKNE